LNRGRQLVSPSPALAAEVPWLPLRFHGSLFFAKVKF
jgi:hypothetical protein